MHWRLPIDLTTGWCPEQLWRACVLRRAERKGHKGHSQGLLLRRLPLRFAALDTRPDHEENKGKKRDTNNLGIYLVILTYTHFPSRGPKSPD